MPGDTTVDIEKPGKCRGCGKRIYWRTTAAGKNAPYDEPAACPTCGGEGCQRCDMGGRIQRSHFSTCKDANRFRRQ